MWFSSRGAATLGVLSDSVPPDLRPSVSPEADKMAGEVSRKKAAALEAMLSRASKTKTVPKLREVVSEIQFAYACLARGHDFFYEPAIDMAGALKLRPASAGEKKSDFAVWPSGRLINVEIKTPLPANARSPTNYVLFEEEFGRQTMKALVGVDTELDISFIAQQSVATGTKQVQEFGKRVRRALDTAIRRVIAPGATMGEFVQVKMEGVVVGSVAVKRGRAPVAWVYSVGSQSWEPRHLIDSGQLAKGCPNVVLVFVIGGIPFPPQLRQKFLGEFAGIGAFRPGQFTRVSALACEYSHAKHHTIENPHAVEPLSNDEVAFFDAPYEFP